MTEVARVRLIGGGGALLEIVGEPGRLTSLQMQLLDDTGASTKTVVLNAGYYSDGRTAPLGLDVFENVGLVALLGGGLAVAYDRIHWNDLGGASDTQVIMSLDAEGVATGSVSTRVSNTGQKIEFHSFPSLVPLPSGGFVVVSENLAGRLGEFIDVAIYSDHSERITGLRLNGIVAVRPTDFQPRPSVFDTSQGLMLAYDTDGGPKQAFVSYAGQLQGDPIPIRVFASTPGDDNLGFTFGPDSLSGGEGHDFMAGGPGADVLAGGSGADDFVLGEDVDVVLDFDAAQGDRFLLTDPDRALRLGTEGVAFWNQQTSALSWDPDGDGGPQPALLVAALHGTLAPLGPANFQANGFAPAIVRVLRPDGEFEEIRFDRHGVSLAYTRTIQAMDGRVHVFEIGYDDGATSRRTNEIAGTQAWSSAVAERDGQGRLFAYTVFQDDGGLTAWRFDVNGAQTWSRVVEIYDPLGRLSVQAAAMDDGAAWERYVDTYDQHAWAYHIDNYRQGALTDQTFYNADGSVFAG